MNKLDELARRFENNNIHLCRIGQDNLKVISYENCVESAYKAGFKKSQELAVQVCMNSMNRNESQSKGSPSWIANEEAKYIKQEIQNLGGEEK